MYRAQVTIRHFSANNYVNDKDPSAVWNGVSQRSSTKSVLKQIKKKILVKHNVHLQMGNNITCTIDPTTQAPTLSLPSSFDPGWKMLNYRFAFRVCEFGLNYYTLNFAAKPLKLHTHGFMDTTAGEGTLSKHTYFVNGESWYLRCYCYFAVGDAVIAQNFGLRS